MNAGRASPHVHHVSKIKGEPPCCPIDPTDVFGIGLRGGFLSFGGENFATGMAT